MDTSSDPVSPAVSGKTQLASFTEACEAQLDERFSSPQAFHDFSVRRFRDFWRLFLEWADPAREGEPEPVCTDDRCEFASFFPNLRLSYAENLLESRSPGEDEQIALVGRRGDGSRRELTRRELREKVRTVAAHLRALGIEPGDRVVAIAANTPEATIGALAAVALGATFSSAAPEMGAPAILSRFEQLAPKLLLADLGADSTAEVVKSLPSLEALVALDDRPAPAGIELPLHRLAELAATPPPQPLP